MIAPGLDLTIVFKAVSSQVYNSKKSLLFFKKLFLSSLEDAVNPITLYPLSFALLAE